MASLCVWAFDLEPILRDLGGFLRQPPWTPRKVSSRRRGLAIGSYVNVGVRKVGVVFGVIHFSSPLSK